MKKKNALFVFVSALVLLSLLSLLPGKKTSERQILVLHAGSLSIPFKDMARAFTAKYPQVEVVLEAYGSRTCARQISDLGRRVDVMASADSAVIRNLLIPDHADFCIDFTSNEMAIMYTDRSRFADEINGSNWYKILLRPGVEYGHSDPNADPCGYRSLLTWQLAEKHYREPDLYRRLQERMPQKNIRSKEVDLIALLEAGQLDYIFIYRSVAKQHHMPHLLLPLEINLQSSSMADFYREASLKITGKKPGQWIEKRGAPMIYGITLPQKAPNPDWAGRFIAFVLGKEGQRIMAKNGQPPVHPPRVDHPEKLPAVLKPFFK